jgi:ParB family chromosome partitioning protein
MTEEPQRTRLGRGLAALIGDVGEESLGRAGAQRRLPIAFLRPNPRNPRKDFAPADLDELAESIRTKGLLQPILARAVPGARDAYEIVAGERRWRAAQRAGLHEVPIILVEASDRESLELAIIENVQRTDLNPLEEAVGYERLMTEFGYNQTDLAKIIGKSRSHVANTLRLLKLPESVKQHVLDGRLTAGHARSLVSQDDPEALAERIVALGLSVREAEALAQERKTPRAPKPDKGADIRALEKSLSDSLGLRISIQARGEAGEIRIAYGTLEQLDEICRRLGS